MPEVDIQIKSPTSGKKQKIKPIQVYIMTKMYQGGYNKTFDEIKRLNDIEKISFVTGTGSYDIVMRGNVKNLGCLHRLVSQIQAIKGVEKTNTQVIVKEYKVLNNR
ncbi:MAG: Lrp/AsnC ligand binding domain-containing protein [Candidatus Thermoplasmatota archaeon]